MPTADSSLNVVPFLHLGPLHISIFGLCAAVGLMAALTLCQVTARLVRLDAAAVWHAGLWMVFAALVFSRLLLVVGNLRSFLAYPLLMLALPSINDTGILLTAIFTVIYLRWRRIPLLGFLDAMAPCFALAWVFFSLGNLLDGTRDGMPTRFFLAMGDQTSPTMRVQPVELYTLIAAMVVCGILIRALPRLRHSGLGCALALVLAGLALFLIDLLRLPSELFPGSHLDPAQWLALAMMTVGLALYIAFPASDRAPATRSSDAV